MFYLLSLFSYETKFGVQKIEMSNDHLENILLIKINGPVLHKIHPFTGNRSLLQKKNWQWNQHTTSKENLGKTKISLFGPPIKRVVLEISSSDDSSSESDLSEPDSN